MSFAYARAQRDTYLLLRMEAEAFGQRIELELAPLDDQSELEHRHGDGCACSLRGE